MYYKRVYTVWCVHIKVNLFISQRLDVSSPSVVYSTALSLSQIMSSVFYRKHGRVLRISQWKRYTRANVY